MTATKVITLRVCEEDARRADLVARTDGMSVNEVFRLALVDYFAAKRADADFVARAQAMIAREAEMVAGPA